MSGDSLIPIYTDDIKTIIGKTAKLKVLFLDKFLSSSGSCGEGTQKIAEEAFDAFAGYNSPIKVSKVVRAIACRPNNNEMVINIKHFEDLFEKIFIEIGVAEKVKVTPCYRGVDLNFDNNNCYTAIKSDVYLFNPDIATSLHFDAFVKKLKDRVGDEVCQEILMEAKLETAYNILIERPN